MLDTWSFVLLAVRISYTVSEYAISSDGWVPITRDRVYNPMNLLHTPLKPQPITSNMIKVIEIQNDQEKEVKLAKKNNTTGNSVLEFTGSVNVDDEISVDNNTNIRKGSKSIRKTKQIEEQDDDDNNNLVNQSSMRKYASILDGEKTTFFGNTANNYEVSENIDDDKSTEQDYFEENLGYNYRPPAKQNLNFSSTLINVLTKYNIKTDDQLQNYILSRQRKTNVPFVRTISHFRHKYNSLNHLSVDPLLAVFLSNYGFYIPSLYGIKSNYNNLYGYLASNNIHNNRPFGLYKIFSDTDSWN